MSYCDKIKLRLCVFSLQNSYLSRLNEIRDTLDTSPFFKTHEVKAHVQWLKPCFTAALCTAAAHEGATTNTNF